MTTSVTLRNAKAALGIVIASIFATGTATAGSLPGWDGSLPTAGNPLTSQQYQDFTIYSLNYLTNLSAQNSTTGTPYYGLLKPISYNVDSSVGKLHDKIVVATGNTGQTGNNSDTCGPTGCDKAYNYTSAPATSFSTLTQADPNTAVPGEPTASMWTAQTSALRSYLNGKDMIFMFNLNEENKNGNDANTLAGQSLLISMKVDLTNAFGKIVESFYVGANNAIGLPKTAAEAWETLGAPNPDPSTSSTTVIQSGDNGYISTDPRWAFVHGAISVDATTGAFLAMGDCAYTKKTNCKTVNQNLGANEVAFAAFNQRLSDIISDANSDIAFMNVTALTSGQSNGFEQLFIMAADVDNNKVPEPTSLALAGLGLMLFGAARRRHQLGIAA